MTSDTDLLLDARGVAKSFGAVRALTDASLTVARGEVVALMGANGAGKSTFVKILTGALRPDTGHVKIRGKQARVGSPGQARRSGLVPVYQEPSTWPITCGSPTRPQRHFAIGWPNSPMATSS